MNQTSPVALPPTKLVVEGLRPSDLLPLEIVHRILEYDGKIKYRHGKYMNQIAQDDVRYKMLKQMPQIQTWEHLFNMYSMSIYSSDKQCCFEKYETLWYSENPHIHVHNTDEIGVSFFKKQDICYKFTILRKPKPTLFSYISKYLYDVYRLFI